MKKLTTLLIAFSLSLLFSISAFAIDDDKSYLRIDDWKVYESKGGVYKNAYNKSSYKRTHNLSDENKNKYGTYIKNWIESHNGYYYAFVFDDYHSPSEVRVYYSTEAFYCIMGDGWSDIYTKNKNLDLNWGGYDGNSPFDVGSIYVGSTGTDWYVCSMGYSIIDCNVPLYLGDEAFAIRDNRDVSTYTYSNYLNDYYDYLTTLDDFNFLTNLQFVNEVQEGASNHLSLPSVDCGFVTNSLSIINTVAQDKQKAKLYITYGMDLYQQSHTSEFIVNCTLRGITDDSNDIFFNGESTFDADGVTLLDIPQGSMGYKPTGKKKFGFFEVEPMTYRGAGRFVIQADIWLTDLEGNSSGHFTKNFNFDYMSLIDTEVTDNSITTNNNPFDSTNGNNTINPPNPDNPIADSPDYNVQSSSGVTVNNNNNVNFPSDINVHVDGVGGGGGGSDDFNFNFGDLGGEAPEGIKDGLGWFDGNNGFLSFLLAFYGNIDPKAKVLITFGIVTTITIAIVRMVFKR